MLARAERTRCALLFAPAAAADRSVQHAVWKGVSAALQLYSPRRSAFELMWVRSGTEAARHLEAAWLQLVRGGAKPPAIGDVSSPSACGVAIADPIGGHASVYPASYSSWHDGDDDVCSWAGAETKFAAWLKAQDEHN